jgi:hypothetical protein
MTKESLIVQTEEYLFVIMSVISYTCFLLCMYTCPGFLCIDQTTIRTLTTLEIIQKN